MNVPKDATHFHMGRYFKRGILGKVFYWSKDEWVLSSCQWSAVSLDPIDNLFKPKKKFKRKSRRLVNQERRALQNG